MYTYIYVYSSLLANGLAPILTDFGVKPTTFVHDEPENQTPPLSSQAGSLQMGGLLSLLTRCLLIYCTPVSGAKFLFNHLQ